VKPRLEFKWDQFKKPEGKGKCLTCLPWNKKEDTQSQSTSNPQAQSISSSKAQGQGKVSTSSPVSSPKDQGKSVSSIASIPKTQDFQQTHVIIKNVNTAFSPEKVTDIIRTKTDLIVKI